MNAIVALCHFCEAHGPCILFSTQAFHSAHDAQLLMDSVPPDKRVPGAGGQYGRGGTSASDASSFPSLMQPPPKSSDTCEGCRSVSPEQPGFISYDAKAQISYLSGQYPEQPQLYSVVRQACVRSLNCEVCPGREGPIVFGEDSGCHVLSHTFNLQDSQARGFNRLYSFIVVMMDRVFLINSWPFLVKHIRKLIDDLQAKANSVYSSESEECKSMSSRSLRSSLSSMQGPDHLRRIRTHETDRSLVELTGDRDVFLNLHKYFVFLLKAGGQRIVEVVLEGPPPVMARAEPVRTSSISGPDEDILHTLDRPVSAPEFSVVTVENQPSFQSLKQFFRVLGQKDFLELANHVLKGDQLIVRGCDVTTVTSIISILKDLVPECCCRIVGYSEEYKEPFVCNFLGLSVGVQLPGHVIASDQHVLLDILPPLKRGEGGGVGGGGGAKLSREEIRSRQQQQSWVIVESHGGGGEGETATDPLKNYKLMVYTAQPRAPEQRTPVFLQRLVALLSSDVMSDVIVDRGLLALKDEWMNKVKVLYKFSQMGHLDAPQRNERLNKLLQEILLVHHEDLPILQYWRSALSKEYKNHLKQSQ